MRSAKIGAMHSVKFPIIMRGGGDLATGVAYRLHQAGYPMIILELPRPLVVRRRVALATAVLEGQVTVETLTARHVTTLAEAKKLARQGLIPILTSPTLDILAGRQPAILIDARLAKRNIDTNINQAGLVIALGPGFTAGLDCHAVIETMRGHRLGRVIWEGSALPNTGTPGIVAGKGAERVLRAPTEGIVRWQYDIGAQVQPGATLGHVAGRPVTAPFAGVLRGLIAPGTAVPAGLKIGDLDARNNIAACFTISDKALAIGAGVLEAIQTAPAPPYPHPSARRHPSLSLPGAFNLTPGDLVSLTGGGGKTSLLFALAAAWPGPVVTTTTTRIFAAQMKLAPEVVVVAGGGWRVESEVPPSTLHSLPSTLRSTLHRYGHCLVVGPVEGEKALGVPPELPGQLLKRPDVTLVIVEADGSRMRPVKAPADHEPVIPPETTLVVPVAGIDALNGRLADVAHRPEQVAALTGLSTEAQLTPDTLAVLLTHPEGGAKGLPPTARLIPFINKVEEEAELALARRAARAMLHEPRVERVVIGALQSARPVREVYRRVTAVVLAAGISSRMGQAKQLLPWGSTTVLGQTIANMQQTALFDLLVISGHEAERVTAVAGQYGVPTLHNPDFAAGEMITSLQTALRNLPVNRDAVLVVLADQPMVPPAVIDRLLLAYREGDGEALAPAYQGRRGNPVLIGRPFFSRLLALPPDAAPRDALQGQVTLVPVDSAAILQDLDTWADYERWRVTGGE